MKYYIAFLFWIVISVVAHFWEIDSVFTAGLVIANIFTASGWIVDDLKDVDGVKGDRL